MVGDFDSDAVVEEVKKLTREWKPGTLAKPQLPAVDKPKQFLTKILTMPDSAQLHFYL